MINKLTRAWEICRLIFCLPYAAYVYFSEIADEERKIKYERGEC